MSHEATSEPGYDAWFRKQVEETMAKVESGTAVLLEHDVMWSQLEAYARELTQCRD